MHTPIKWNSDGWGIPGTDWGEYSKQAMQFFRRLRDAVSEEDEDQPLPACEIEVPELRFAALVIRDLVAIGWKIKVSNADGVMIRPPEKTELDSDSVRAVQMRSRNEQLQSPTIRKFIKGMEKRRLWGNAWHSIFSLVRDGSDLAEKIRIMENDNPLGNIIAPYIQLADPQEKCEHTGFCLYDIWKYFRHTWVTPYQSVPGRSMNLLIRDAAAPNHPVIGIASLGSAVVHQTARDHHIGWQGEDVVEVMMENPSKRYAVWLGETLDSVFESIYILDLISDGTLRELDLRRPDEALITRLEKQSEEYKQRHLKNPGSARINQNELATPEGVDWETIACSDLYRSKRCRLIASFMKVRLAFQKAGFNNATPRALRAAFDDRCFREAVQTLVARVKAERVGIDMMDITVCGAIPPYTHLLGGKLICMLLTSPEVQRIYEERYGNTHSIIASGLKGAPVIRKPKLVCLSTTSLYGRNSSQYNRVSIPAGEVGGKKERRVVYQIGGDGKETHRSQGFGTFHFRKDTLATLDAWIAQKGQKDVNYIFGEGTSPKLRKIRERITEVGLPGDDAMRHSRSRIVYYIALASNVKDYLLGLDKEADWLLPQKDPKSVSDRIAAYWTKRWLSMRIKSTEVLEQVATHDLSYPITHGARVQMPEDPDADPEFDLE